MENNYQLINLIVQGIIGVAIIATFWIYYFQLRIMKKGALGQNALALISYLHEDNNRKARRHVINNLSNKVYIDWTEDDKEIASKVCSIYDVMSIMIYNMELVPQKLFIETWAPGIKKCYLALDDHIQELKN